MVSSPAPQFNHEEWWNKFVPPALLLRITDIVDTESDIDPSHPKYTPTQWATLSFQLHNWPKQAPLDPDTYVYGGVDISLDKLLLPPDGLSFSSFVDLFSNWMDEGRLYYDAPYYSYLEDILIGDLLFAKRRPPRKGDIFAVHMADTGHAADYLKYSVQNQEDKEGFSNWVDSLVQVFAAEVIDFTPYFAELVEPPLFRTRSEYLDKLSTSVQ